MNRLQEFDYSEASGGFTPPVGIAARTDALFDRARAGLEAAGAMTCRADPDHCRPPIWIEIDAVPDAIEEQLIATLDRAAREEGLSIVIAAPRTALDVLASLVSSPGVELLIAPDAIERAAAGAMLAAFASRPATAREARRDPDLRLLSAEVSRIAQALAQLSDDGAGGGGVRDAGASVSSAGEGVVDAARVQAAIRERRLRLKYFDAALFADPAWDMLLDLFSAELSKARVPVSSLCAAAEVPPTTALRWIRAMTAKGLFLRQPDPSDARRVFVALSPQASAAMHRYFAAL